MFLSKTQDNVTKAEYYDITDERQISFFSDLIDPVNFYVGLYKNETRFLTKDKSLVKFHSSNVTRTYELLSIKLESNQSN